MSMTVGRDPFARGEYKRFTWSNIGHFVKCAWCGRVPRRLHAYVWWRDSAKEPQGHLGIWFCNFDCFEDFEK